MNKQKGEYELIYDYEDSRNYEELSENISIEDRMESLRGQIGRGDCIYCGAKDAMIFEGNVCFICSKCGKSIHEDIYYYWAAGGTVNTIE